MDHFFRYALAWIYQGEEEFLPFLAHESEAQALLQAYARGQLRQNWPAGMIEMRTFKVSPGDGRAATTLHDLREDTVIGPHQGEAFEKARQLCSQLDAFSLSSLDKGHLCLDIHGIVLDGQDQAMLYARAISVGRGRERLAQELIDHLNTAAAHRIVALKADPIIATPALSEVAVKALERLDQISGDPLHFKALRVLLRQAPGVEAAMQQKTLEKAVEQAQARPRTRL